MYLLSQHELATLSIFVSPGKPILGKLKLEKSLLSSHSESLALLKKEKCSS